MRLGHRLTLDDRGRLQLQRAQLGALDRALTVERLAERVDHAAEEAVPDRHGKHLAGPLDPLAFLDLAVVTEDDGTDLAHVQVQRQAAGAVLKLKQLVRHRRRQSSDPGDAIATLGDDPYLFLGGTSRLIALDEPRQSVLDLLGPDSKLRHLPRVLLVWLLVIRSGRQIAPQFGEPRLATLPLINSSPILTVMPPTSSGSTTTFRCTSCP